MSFYLNGVSQDTLKISGQYKTGTHLLSTIAIVNSEHFAVDLTELVVVNNGQKLEIIKAIVQFGNREPIISSPVIEIKDEFNTLAGKDEVDFRLFDVNVMFQEGEQKGTLTITVYDSSGSTVEFLVPYTAVLKSISDYGSEFDIVNANITNDDIVSYVLAQRSTDTVMFVASREVSKRYGLATKTEYNTAIEDCTVDLAGLVSVSHELVHKLQTISG